MIDSAKFIQIFSDNKEMFIFRARKKMSSDMFDSADVETLVYDIMYNAIKARKNEGFTNEEHALKYAHKSINKRTRIAYFTKKREMETPLPAREMQKQYILARDIINSIRK